MSAASGLPPATPAGVRAGILMMLGCAFTFASLDVLAKHLSSQVHTLQLVWFRYFFHVALMLLVFGPPMGARLWRTDNPRWQIGRGAILIVCTCLSFAGLSVMPLAEFTAIAFVTPLIVTLLARSFLGEKVSPARWVAVIAGFCGVLIIIRPGGGLFGWAALIPLCLSLVYAVFQILTRKYAGADDPLTTLFFTGLVGALIASGPVLWVWQAPTLQQWPLLVALGLCGAGGHLLLILAFQRAPASSLAPISYTQLLFATGLGVVVTHHVPDGWTLVGMGVIAAAGLYAALLQGMQGMAGRKRAGDEADIPLSD